MQPILEYLAGETIDLIFSVPRCFLGESVFFYVLRVKEFPRAPGVLRLEKRRF
jgi:hypothetical protein